MPNFNNRVPLLGQPQQQMQAHLQAAIAQLGMDIYARVASERLQAYRFERADFVDLAKQSESAALAYFEGIGVIKPQEENKGD